MIILEKHLTDRQLRFLRLLYPDGTIGVGLAVGADLARAGYVERTKHQRYALTERGRKMVERRAK